MNTESRALTVENSWNGALSADPGCIDLWLMSTTMSLASQTLAGYREVLSAEERAQELRFHFDKDQRRYLFTRALVRCVLSRYARVRPQDWCFSANEYGRPHIAGSGVDASPGLDFSVTHTAGLIVLAVSRQRRLGIDCESIAARDDCTSIADRFFAARELRALQALPMAQRHRSFLEFWTLKESYIKARGMGLSIPLNEFSFAISGSEIGFEADPKLDAQASGWRFVQFMASPEHVVAVCAHCPDAAMPVLRAFTAVPLVMANPIHINLLRASSGTCAASRISAR